MPYFTPDFVSFFQELAQNNNRDWFQANKPRFEKHVKSNLSRVLSIINLSKRLTTRSSTFPATPSTPAAGR